MPVVRTLKAAAVFFVAAAMLLTAPNRAVAQRTDVIRGRVTGMDSAALVNAIVTVRDSAAATPPKSTRTDDKGAYSVSMSGGSGIYVVSAQMLGYAPQRRTIHRPPGDS